MDPHWKDVLAPQFEANYFRTLMQRVKADAAKGPVYPLPKRFFQPSP